MNQVELYFLLQNICTFIGIGILIIWLLIIFLSIIFEYLKDVIKNIRKKFKR